MNNNIDPTSSWDNRFDELVERVASDTADAWAHTGAQLYVAVDNTAAIDVACGVGHTEQAFTRDTLSALYCSSKPVIATAVLASVESGELSLDDQVGHIINLGEGTWIAELTVGNILTHTAGLHTLPEIVARILPTSMRRDVIATLTKPPGWRVGIDGTYAPFAGWWILAEILEALWDTSYTEYVNTSVLAPYGVAPDRLICGFNPDTYAAQRHRLSATYDFARDPQIPLLAEVGAATCCEWNPSFGSYGTAAGLGQFYQGVAADLGGANLVLGTDLATTATTPRASTYDEVLGRDASFGLGFMCELSEHHFGNQISERSFGHAGQGGTSWAFCDAERNLVISAVFNGGADEDTALRWRRANLVTSIYNTLDLGH